ncbi:hypothetical protein CH267_01030 [Rhodococcus sp. 06-621-2]|nr:MULTISPECIES: hypothetical protein [unclassified Rhodococcus (in: high G+C Gram-positive bacteria)]OZC62157.1 hypothetical protein CH267_01030 [Rhodococcus sp. 06-621-2]OZF09804.1 hypothetical protein CH300_00035 [Rhodococcus sp. 15-1154-1]
MRWPWTARLEDAQAQAKEAAEVHAHSVERRIKSEHERAEAVEVTDVLWKELRRNGWTEMLQQAWGGR